MADSLGRPILKSYKQWRETRHPFQILLFFVLVSIYASLLSSLSICCFFDNLHCEPCIGLLNLLALLLATKSTCFYFPPPVTVSPCEWPIWISMLMRLPCTPFFACLSLSLGCITCSINTFCVWLEPAPAFRSWQIPQNHKGYRCFRTGLPGWFWCPFPWTLPWL